MEQKGKDVKATVNRHNTSSKKSELLKRMDTQTHVRTIFFRICAIFLPLNAKLAKQAHLIFFAQSFLASYMFFLTISAHNSAQNFMKVNFNRAKKTF